MAIEYLYRAGIITLGLVNIGLVGVLLLAR